MYSLFSKAAFLKILASFATLMFICIPWQARADVITWEMTGLAVFSSSPLPGISIGDPFSASLTFDSSLATSLSFYVAPPFGVVSSTITYHTVDGDITFTSNTTSDAFFRALNDLKVGVEPNVSVGDEIQITFDSGGIYAPRISYRFIDEDAVILDGASHFPTDIDLADWEFAGVTLIDSSDTQRDVRGDINSLTVLHEVSTYSVGGNVTGLTSNDLVLQNNGSDDLPIIADGSFTFTTKLADTATYAVTVSTQPTSQTCSVTNGSGTIAAADVTNIALTCVDDVVVPPMPATPIPTASQWALILLSMLIILMAFANRRRLF